MDPNSLGNMMNMFNNPDTMSKMKDMMQQPEIQNMMNNPDIMSKMMGMFGGAKPEDMSADDNSNATPDSATSDSATSDSATPTPLETITEDSKELLFLEDDNVVLGNLKNEKYNDLHGVILGYNQEKQRYIVRVSFNNDAELDNEEDDTETISEADLETVTLEEGEGEATPECCKGEASPECCKGEASPECCKGEASPECCKGEATPECCKGEGEASPDCCKGEGEGTPECCKGEGVTDGLETVTLEPVRELEPEFCDIMVKEENLTLLDMSSYSDSTPLTEIN